MIQQLHINFIFIYIICNMEHLKTQDIPFFIAIHFYVHTRDMHFHAFRMLFSAKTSTLFIEENFTPIHLFPLTLFNRITNDNSHNFHLYKFISIFYSFSFTYKLKPLFPFFSCLFAYNHHSDCGRRTGRL